MESHSIFQWGGGQLDFVLHIGLPKTATTTLQKWVFPSNPNYLGKFYGTEASETASLLRESLATYTRRDENWQEYLHHAFDKAPKLARESWFFSSESLWPGGLRMPFADDYVVPDSAGPHPLTGLFHELRSASLRADTKVKIIVSFRNQSDLFGSLYAQLASSMAYPGQRDFLRKVDTILSRDSGDFDYSSLAQNLVDSLGEKNVLFLFFEDGLEVNIDEIGRFVGFDFGHEPARREQWRFGAGSWSSDRMLVPLTKTGLAGSFRRFLDQRLPDSGLTKTNLQRVAHSVDRLALRRAHLKKVSIRVPQQVDKRIKDRFSASNRKLETLVHRDLGELGYF